MNILVKAGVAAVAILGSVAAASAATVNFNFANSSNSTPSYESGQTLSFAKGGLTLDVSAYGYNTPSTPGEEITTTYGLNVSRQDNYGLFVVSYPHDNHRIDGYWNEVVTFDFDKTDVSIKRIRFGSYYHGSEFDLYVGNNGKLYYEGSNEVANWVRLDTQTSSLFAIGASENHSAFKIKKLVVHVEEDNNEPEPVPLPAGGALLLSALGVLAWRRKTA